MCFGFLLNIRRRPVASDAADNVAIENSNTPPEQQCKMYNEKDLTLMLKGHVKRLCNYFQNEIPKKEHSNTLKAIMANSKARQAAITNGAETSYTSTKKEIPLNRCNKHMLNRASRKAIGVTDFAQHLCGHRCNSTLPTTHHEALSYLEKEGISYNNALMLMESEKPGLPTKQVFNWKSAMKAMCSDSAAPETSGLDMLEDADTFSIYIPLPLEPSMREFMRNCGFVIDETGIPVCDTESLGYDAVQFYIFHSNNPKQEESNEKEVNTKTGHNVPQASHGPKTPKVYDIHNNKVTTEAGVFPDEHEDEFERAVSSDLSILSYDRMETSDSFAEDIFSSTDPDNFYKAIEEMRKLMPEECDGIDGDPKDISTGRSESITKSFGWFLDKLEDPGKKNPETDDAKVEDGTKDQYASP